MTEYTTFLLLAQECAEQSRLTRELEDNSVHDEDRKRARLRAVLWQDASQILTRVAFKSLRAEPLSNQQQEGGEEPCVTTKEFQESPVSASNAAPESNPLGAATPTPRTAEDVARLFHEIYERRAAEFGYETRPDTKAFDPDSKNGRLMVAVCSEVIASYERSLTAVTAERNANWQNVVLQRETSEKLARQLAAVTHEKASQLTVEIAREQCQRCARRWSPSIIEGGICVFCQLAAVTKERDEQAEKRHQANARWLSTSKLADAEIADLRAQLTSSYANNAALVDAQTIDRRALVERDETIRVLTNKLAKAEAERDEASKCANDFFASCGHGPAPFVIADWPELFEAIHKSLNRWIKWHDEAKSALASRDAEIAELQNVIAAWPTTEAEVIASLRAEIATLKAERDEARFALTGSLRGLERS